MSQVRLKELNVVSVTLAETSITSVEIGALDTSRSREFDLRGMRIGWNMTNRPQKEILAFEQFQAIITEETLSIGNISTHIVLRFKWDALTKGNLPITLKCYDKNGGGLLYDLSFPSVSFDCGGGYYNSGLINLQHNHFDIISMVTPIFPSTFNMSGEHPCDE